MLMLAWGVALLGLVHSSIACQDIESDRSCRYWRRKGYCDNGKYQSFMKKNCAKTCGFCNGPEITTQVPQTTQPSGGSGTCGQKASGHTRIVGGTNARPGDWPWQASVHYSWSPGINRQWCGGTLIDEEWVLSAAHCFDDKNVRRYWFKLGEHDLRVDSTSEQTRRAKEIHVYPQYNTKTSDYDLALIKLESKVQLNDRVRTACLPGANTQFPAGTNCAISGWGKLSESIAGPAILQQAQVPLASQAACQKAYHRYKITDRMICAGAAQGKIDACQGDSGGPLVCKDSQDAWYVVGATSWGVGCARRGLYGVYADVKNTRQWVNKVAGV